MTNRIRNTTVQVSRLSPAEAEVLVTVEVDTVTATTELRGKVVGPRCPGAATVEVAYPLRALPSSADEPSNLVAARALIPEPNLWTPVTPFSYEAKVELWQDGSCCDTAFLSVALKLGQKRDR